MIYDVQVGSLHPKLFKQNKVWVHGISAKSLTEACHFAEALHPNLGCTPTTTYNAWYQWPQPKILKTHNT